MVLGLVVFKICDVEIDNNSVYRFVVISGGQFLTQPHIILNITTIKRKSILNDIFLNVSMSYTSRSPSLLGIKLDLSLLEHHLNDKIIISKQQKYIITFHFTYFNFHHIARSPIDCLLSVCLYVCRRFCVHGFSESTSSITLKLSHKMTVISLQPGKEYLECRSKVKVTMT